MKLLPWFYYVPFILACDSYVIYCDSKYRRRTAEVGTMSLPDSPNRFVCFADVVFSGSWLQVYAVPGNPVVYKSHSDWLLRSFGDCDSNEFYCKYRSSIEKIIYLAQ